MLLCVIQFDYIHKYRKKERKKERKKDRKKERKRKRERKRKKEYMSRNIYFLGMFSGKFKTFDKNKISTFKTFTFCVCVRACGGGGRTTFTGYYCF